MHPNERFEDIIHRLFDVLNREHSCLLSGDFSNLAEISSAKERDLSLLETHLSGLNSGNIISMHAQRIERLRKRASENEMLLHATRTGVKSAQERLAHLNKIDTVVGTYTESGGQLRLEGSATTCKKIA